jgi:PAS domain S-box-containing protein
MVFSVGGIVEKEKYLEIINSLQEAVIVVDRNYRIDNANETACLVTKKGLDQVIGKHCYEITHLNKEPCFKSGVECPVKAVFETGQRTRVIHKHLSEDGTARWEEIIASPFTKEKGEVTHVIEEIRDCSELLKNKEIIEELKSEVKTLQGMLPICSKCKNIRNDEGYWETVEGYIGNNSDTVFTHGLCPVCAKELYPEYYKGP